MRVAVAVALLTACSFKSGSATIDAPDIITHDVPVDLPADDDSDGDGVDNDHDNCPTVKNPDQHDEDGDGVGDACDPCPQIAHEASTDSDGDGIPDACDPRPLPTQHDTLLAFLPMTGTTLPAGWTVVTSNPGAFVVADDLLTIVAPDNTPTVIEFPIADQTYSIEIGVDLIANTATGANPSFIEPITNATADFGTFNGCATRVDPPAKRELVHDDPAGGFQTVRSDTTNAPTVPGSYRLILVQDMNAVVCTIPGGGSPLASTILETGDHLGIFAEGMTAKIRYVALYH